MTELSESDFHEHIDDTLIAIEEAIDEASLNIDYETSGGILTLTFDDDSRIIINRQTPSRQLWVAAKAGGFHFNYDSENGVWLHDADKEELFYMLGRLCSEQSGQNVNFN